jgi:hypothetical protein
VKGSDDNSSFSISDNQLQTALNDYDPMKNYYIRVRQTDSGSPALSYERISHPNICKSAATITGLPESLTILEEENTRRCCFHHWR